MNQLQHQQYQYNAVVITEEELKPLCLQLIYSSWSGLLSAFVPLVDTSIDESTTDNILKAMQNFAAICGVLDLLNPRDAFIMAICKAAFPPHYAMSIFANNPHIDVDLHCEFRTIEIAFRRNSVTCDAFSFTFRSWTH